VSIRTDFAYNEIVHVTNFNRIRIIILRKNNIDFTDNFNSKYLKTLRHCDQLQTRNNTPNFELIEILAEIKQIVVIRTRRRS